MLKIIRLYSFIFFFMLLILEMALRGYWSIYYPPESDKVVNNANDLIRLSVDQTLGYKLRRNIKKTFKDVEIVTNNLGFRESNLDPRRDIFALGDSVMMGWGVEREDHFLSIIKNKLNLSYYNAGILGYNTRQEYLVAKHLLNVVKPRCTIHLFVGNDIIENDNYFKKLPFNTESYLLNSIQIAYLKAFNDDQSNFSMQKLINIKTNYDFKSSFIELIKLHQINNIPLIILLDSRYQNEQFLHAKVQAIGERHGALVIDLYNILRHTKDTHLKPEDPSDRHNELFILKGFKNDYHPNTAWHRKVFEVIEKKVKKICK